MIETVMHRNGYNRSGYDKNGNYVAHCDNCRLRVRNECTQVRSKLCEDYEETDDEDDEDDDY